MAVFIHDTRDQKGKHDNVEQYLAARGHTLVRSKMYVGDIAYLCNQSVVIDLKRDLQEVYQNLVGAKAHARFKAECVRAQEAGIRLIVLVEQAGVKTLADVRNWKNSRAEYYEMVKNAHQNGKMLNRPLPKKPPVSSSRLENIMRTMAERYGCEWHFCDRRHTGAEILRLLGERAT